jgi:hypothetical protein
MTAMIDGAFGASVFSSCVQFAIFLAIGVATGWLLTRPRKWCAWSNSLSMIGVCGAWLGAEFTHLFGQGARSGVDQLAAAALGAFALAYAWRRLHPAPEASDDIAMRHSHA